jgi:hypothetical protein
MIVSVNSSNSSIEVLPLIDLEKNTHFTIKIGVGEESEFDVTLNEFVSAGSSILITNDGANQYSTNGELDLDSVSDQATIVQKDEGVIRFLFNSSWGDKTFLTANYLVGAIPSIQLGEGANHQYYLKNGASGTTAMIRRMITDPANWSSSKNPFNQIQTSFRILAAPVIVFNQNLSTVMEGDSIPLNVAIYEHDGSRLTVDVVLNEAFSTADTNDINVIQTYTYNFTGLIGDAVYEIAIPQFDDSFFEDKETAFFELRNLTAGSFGDFVSHATFIVDNEIPDLTITSVFSGNEINKDFLEIRNNERVYVNIDNWKIKVGESLFELENQVDLAPFEQRRFTSEDLKAIGNESEDIFIISSGLIVLHDSYGNSVTDFEFIDQQIIESEIGSNQNNELSLDFNQSENLVQQINSETNNTLEKEVTIAPITEGWYPVNSTFIENSFEIYWDEKLSRFRSVEGVQEDSLIGISRFAFNEPESVESEQYRLVGDSLNIEVIPELNADHSITLSATDFDENGIINDAEGYNFVQFKGADSISVSSFLYLVEEQIGKGLIHPVLHKVDESLNLIPLRNSEVLFENDFILIKADSLFEVTQLELDPASIISYDASSIEDEPISNFHLKIVSESASNLLEFNFYEVEAELPNSIINPVLDLGFNIKSVDALIIGAYSNVNWNSEINMAYDQETLMRFPLGISNDEDAELKIQLDEWNMEGGWRLFIEDIESDEITELFPGEDFKFEYIIESSSEDIGEQESLISTSFINERYHLLIASPDYEETLLDEPEIIQLNQNYPNPFNPATTISFFIPEAVEVKLSVFNVVGQPIAVLEEGTLSAGEHHYEWNASGYPSGMYIYQLEVGTKVMTRKMTLVK